ncbi:unnamed protein product [Ranitomeya imitator]|uniref:Proteasome inhibitor PI31 subunit n=1 Tax=Ranitomeya imitator TaxID=111125 RepID=A0ABN9KMV4_9NEOB|nr:unnamed protein product [Ranitomeya imitator]
MKKKMNKVKKLMSRMLMMMKMKAGAQETGTERLPDGWANNKELYTLRYGRGTSQILLKALTVEDALIVNAMELQSDKVSDVTLKIEDFIDSAQIGQYHRVYKNPVELKRQLQAKLFSPLFGSKKENVKAEKPRERPQADDDPLRVPTRNPASRHPPWPDPDHLPPPGYDDMFM